MKRTILSLAVMLAATAAFAQRGPLAQALKNNVFTFSYPEGWTVKMKWIRLKRPERSEV